MCEIFDDIIPRSYWMWHLSYVQGIFVHSFSEEYEKNMRDLMEKGDKSVDSLSKPINESIFTPHHEYLNGSKEKTERFSYEKNREIFDKLEADILKSRMLRNYGYYQEALALAEEAAKLAKSNIKYFVNSEVKALVAQAYALIRIGEYNKGLAALLQAEMYITSDSGAHRVPYSSQYPVSSIVTDIRLYNAKGHIYEIQGKLNEAFDSYQKSLSQLQDYFTKRSTTINYHNKTQPRMVKYTLLLVNYYSAHSYENLGKILFLKRELDEGTDYLQKALALFQKIGNNFRVSGALFLLIRIALFKQDYISAKQLLNELENIKDPSNNIIINSRIQLARALILKQKKRVRSKVQAEKILSDLLNQKEVDSELSLLATQHLCELLLDELKTSGKPDVLTEANRLIKQLFDVGEHHNSDLIKGEALILQAKFKLLEGDISTSTELLEQAITISEKEGLRILLLKAQNEKEMLENQMDTWKTLIDQNASMYERLEHGCLLEYVKEAQQICLDRKK